LATADESVQQAAERMHQRTVGTLIVVDDTQQPIGIVTDRDLVIRVLAEGRDPQATTVGRAMTAQPETALEDTPLELALERMGRGGFRRMPVVDNSGRLVGLVTLDDILLLLAGEFEQAGKLLAQQTPRAAAGAL
jgi:CBS domain-containing protein